MHPDRQAGLGRAAVLLAQARRDVAVLPEIPADIRPANLAEAYYVSDRLASELGWEIGGWYCAATNTSIQELLELDEPYYGRLFDRLIFAGPATLDAALFPPMMVEMEVAFRLGADLPARTEPYSRDEVAAAVTHVAGSIEIVAGHLADWMTQDAHSVIADNGTDGALVLGAEHTDWRAMDLAAVEVEVTRNGVVERRGSGANVLGDPLNAMTWLANARAGRGDGLRGGHIHNTGTLTRPLAVAPGDVVVADFGVLGAVRLELN